MSSQAGKTHLTIKAHDDSYWDTHDNYEVVKKKQGVAENKLPKPYKKWAS
jgi:hypothetical protein